MRDYQKHIRHPHADQKGKAVCGAGIEVFDWTFIDIDHAFLSLPVSYVQPCPACAKIVADTFAAAE